MHSWIRFILVAALMAFPSVALAALEPGLRLRVYDIGEEMDRLFALKSDQTPNYEKVLPSIDLKEPDTFGGLTKNFRTEVTATLRVTRPGVYAFRLTCDDGGKLYVDDHAIINHDVESSVAGLEAVVRAARCRTSRVGPGARAVLATFDDLPG